MRRKINGEAVTECNRIDLRRDMKVREARGLVGSPSAVVDGGDDIIDDSGWMSLFTTVCGVVVAAACDARVDWPRNFKVDIAKGLGRENAVLVVNFVRKGPERLLCRSDVNIRDA